MSERFTLEPFFLAKNEFVWYAVAGLLGVAILCFCLAVFYTSGRNKVYLVRNPVPNTFTLQRYALSFKTSLLPGSGLPDSVVIRVSLVGTKGSSPYVTLIRPLFPLGALLRGQEDVFLIHFERSVGEVCGVSLYLENTELLDDKWLLNEVNVYDPQREVRCCFPVQDDLILSSQKREHRILINDQSKRSLSVTSWFAHKFLALHSLWTLISLPQEVGLMKMTMKIVLLTSTASLLYMSNLVTFILTHQQSESVSFWIILGHSLIGHIVVWVICCICEIIARNIRPKWSFVENRVDRAVLLKPMRPICPCCEFYSDRYITHIYGCQFGVDGAGDKAPAVPVVEKRAEISIPLIQQVGFVSSISSLNKTKKSLFETPIELQDISPKFVDEKIETATINIIDSDMSIDKKEAKLHNSVDENEKRDKFADNESKGMEDIMYLKQFTQPGHLLDKLQDEIEAFDNKSKGMEDIMYLKQFTQPGHLLDKLQDEIEAFDKILNNFPPAENLQGISSKEKKKRHDVKKLGNQTDDDKMASWYSVTKMEKMLEGFEKDLQQDMDTIRRLLEAEKTYKYAEEQGGDSNTSSSSSEGACCLHKSTNIKLENLVKKDASSGNSSTQSDDMSEASLSSGKTRKRHRRRKKKRMTMSTEDSAISQSIHTSCTCIENIVEQDFDGLFKEICQIDEHLRSHGVKSPRVKILLSNKYPTVPCIYRAIYSTPDHIDKVVINCDEKPSAQKKVTKIVKKEISVPEVRKLEVYENFTKSSETISPDRTQDISTKNLPTLNLPSDKDESNLGNEACSKNRMPLHKSGSIRKQPSAEYRRIPRSSLRLDQLLPSGIDNINILKNIIAPEGPSGPLHELEEDIFIYDGVLQNSGASNSPKVKQLLNMELYDNDNKFALTSDDDYSGPDVPVNFDLNKIHMTSKFPLNTSRYIQELKDNKQVKKFDTVKKDLKNLDLVIKDSGADESPVVKQFLRKKEEVKSVQKTLRDFSQRVCPTNLLSVSDNTSQWLTNTDVFRSLLEPDQEAIQEILQDIHLLDTSLKLSGAGSQKPANRLMSSKYLDQESSDGNSKKLPVTGEIPGNIASKISRKKIVASSSESESSSRTTTSSLKSKSREKVIGLMKSIVDGGEDSNIIQKLLTDFQALDKILQESGVASSPVAQNFMSDTSSGPRSQLCASSMKGSTSSQSERSVKHRMSKSSNPIAESNSSTKYDTADEGSYTDEKADKGVNIFGRFLEDVRSLELSLQRQGAVLSSTCSDGSQDGMTQQDITSDNLVDSDASIAKSDRPSSCYTTGSDEESESEDVGPPTSTSMLKAIACLNSPRKPIRSILEDIDHFDKIIHQSGACRPARKVLPNYLIVKSPKFYCRNSENLKKESLDLDNYILQGLSSRSSCNAEKSETEDNVEDSTSVAKQSSGKTIDIEDGIKMLKSLVADPRDTPFLEILQDINDFDSAIDTGGTDNLSVNRLMRQNVDWVADRERDMAKYEPLRNYSSKEWNDGLVQQARKRKQRERKKSTRTTEKKCSSSKELNAVSKGVESSFNSLSSSHIGFEDSSTFFPTDEQYRDSLVKMKVSVSAEPGSEEAQKSDTGTLEDLPTPDKRNFLMNRILFELNSFHNLVDSLDGVDQDMLDNLTSLLQDDERDLIIELSKPNKKEEDFLSTEMSNPDSVKIKDVEDQDYPAILPPSLSKDQLIPNIPDYPAILPPSLSKDQLTPNIQDYPAILPPSLSKDQLTPNVFSPESKITKEINQKENVDEEQVDLSDIDKKWRNLVPDIPARHSLAGTLQYIQQNGSYPTVCDCVIEILSQALVDSAMKHARQELGHDYNITLNVFHKYLVNGTVIDLLKKWQIPAYSDIFDKVLLDVFGHLHQQGYGRMRRPDENLAAALLLQRLSQKSDNMFNLDLFSDHTSSGPFSLKLAEIIGLEKSLADNLRKKYKKQMKTELRMFLKDIKDEVTYSLSAELPLSYLSSVFLFNIDQCVERTKCLPVDVFHQALTRDWTFLKQRTQTEEDSLLEETKHTKKEQLAQTNQKTKGGKGKKSSEKPVQSLDKREQSKQVSFNPKLEQTLTIPSRHESGQKRTIQNSKEKGDGLDSVTKDVKQLGRYLQYVVHDEKRRQELEVSDHCLRNKDKLDIFLVDNLQKVSDFQQTLGKEPTLPGEVLEGVQAEVCGYSRLPIPWIVFPCLLIFLCLSIGSSLLYTLLKGPDLKPNESGLWIACVIIGVVCEIIIFQPIKTFIWMICLKIRQSRKKPANNSEVFEV